MTRGSLRTASVALALTAGLLVAGGVTTPAPVYAAKAFDSGPATRCAERGSVLELPSVRWMAEDGPAVGRLVRWTYWSVADGERFVTDPVAVDETGVARPPEIDLRLDGPARVQLQPEVDGVFTTGRSHAVRMAGEDLFGGDIHAHRELPFSLDAGIYGARPKTWTIGPDGGCVEASVDGAEVTVWAVDTVTSERFELGRTVTEPDRFWRVRTHYPAPGSYRLDATMTWREARVDRRMSGEVTVRKDDPRLDVYSRDALTDGTSYRVPPGDSFTLTVLWNLKNERLLLPADATRTIELRFRDKATGRVTRLPDVTVRHRGLEWSADVRRTMTTSGTFEVRYPGSRNELPASHSVAVATAPKISFPARTTRARPYRAVHRTVRIREAAGMRARLEHRTRNGWQASGKARRIPANGRVRLGSRNDTKKNQKHRVVVSQKIGRDHWVVVAISKPTWTVRNR